MPRNPHTPDRRQVSKTASQAYDERHAIISRQVDALRSALSRHQGAQELCSSDWSFPGDLAQVESHLSHALRMLGVEMLPDGTLMRLHKPGQEPH